MKKKLVLLFIIAIIGNLLFIMYYQTSKDLVPVEPLNSQTPLPTSTVTLEPSVSPTIATSLETEQLLLLESKFNELGYTEDEITTLVTNLEWFELTPILVFNHLDDIDAYIADCLQHRDTNDENTFILSNTYVDYMSEGIAVSNPDEDDILVNKHYYLASDYNPEIIALPENYARDGMGLREDAYNQFIKMADAAKEEGLKIYGTSGYRSYQRQATLYNGYVEKWGTSEADAVSARPGFSEHQTGLAMDLTVDGGLTSFTDTKEFTWMKANAYKYGFILRYPENKTSITGYSFESWHYRYLGIDLATKVYESHLTFDEYYALYLS